MASAQPRLRSTTAPGLLFGTDRLSFNFSQGEDFSYSSRTCGGPAPFNDLGLDFTLAPSLSRELRGAVLAGTNSKVVTWAGRAAMGAGVGVAGVYAYGGVKFRRTAAVGFDLPDPPPPGSTEFARVIEGLTGAPLRHGNRVKVLRNGCQTFPAMLEALSAAKETIDFSSYIYWPEEITEEFTQALIERAEARR